MKLDWNKRYTTIAIYAFLVIFCVILCVFFFLDFGTFARLFARVLSIFRPILYGVLITYILCPMVRFFEKRVFSPLDKKRHYHLKRILSVICAFIFVVLVLILFIWRVLPQVFRGYADLQNRSGFYLATVKEWLLGLSVGEGAIAGYLQRIIEYATGLLDNIYSSFGSILPDVAGVAGALVGVLQDLLLGIILAIYFLFSKERLIAQIKKAAHALLGRAKYTVCAKGATLADNKFGGYIKGQLADALIVGTLCFVCTFIIGIPYYPLVSVLVGISCIIPVFGLTIGTLVGALIILLTSPIDMLWFILFMIVLHQVNKRMIRPHLVHSSGDASAAFMFTAIIIMTGLLGFWGLIIGVPVFAILYTLLSSYVDRRLARKGLSTDIYEYYSTETGKELHLEEEAKKKRRAGGDEAPDGDTVFTEEVPTVTEKDGEVHKQELSAENAPDSSETEEPAPQEEP